MFVVIVKGQTVEESNTMMMSLAQGGSSVAEQVASSLREAPERLIATVPQKAWEA